MSLSTADPYGAQAHARAQGATRVETMPTLPPEAAENWPEGIADTDKVWAETVAPGGYTSKIVRRGTRIELTDLYGDASVSLMLFNAEFPTERLNVADTVKIQWNGYLRAGRFLLSDMGRVMASILEDDAGTHDTFAGASNEASNARKYDDGHNFGAHPNARDRFRIAVAKYGLGRKDIHPCINLFKGVRIEDDGGMTPQTGPFAPGRKVVLRAEMDMIVIIANCPHVLDPRPDYCVSALRLRGWRAPVTSADDAIRTATPEGLRAFLNTEDYYNR